LEIVFKRDFYYHCQTSLSPFLCGWFYGAVSKSGYTTLNSSMRENWKEFGKKRLLGNPGIIAEVV